MNGNLRYAIVDIETSGGNPARDRITEIAVYLLDGEELVDEFTTLINPEVPIPDFITSITGIDNEMVRHAPRFFEVARRIVEITEGAVFVAHNVRFDYSFIQKEFRSLGYTFSRRQLCTVRLSRKILPGYPSYSLKNICAALGIHNDARHRAYGDAAATVTLFRKLLQTDEPHIHSMVSRQSVAMLKLPPQLDPKEMDNLPEETGVYYFHNRNDHVIYVGKSNNIRKRVLSHFQSAFNSSHTIQKLEDIASITYEVTGSELMAMLRENEEIKRLQPLYNKVQLRTKYKYGIYAEPDANGYLNVSAGAYDVTRGPVAGFSSKAHAESAIKRRAHEHQLCLRLCGLEQGKGRCFYRQLHLCKGACEGEESPGDYNERVMQAMEYTGAIHRKESYLVISEGRTVNERSVVWVDKGVLKGYGYLDLEMAALRPEEITDMLTPSQDLPDVARIVRGYVKKHPKEVKALLS